MSGSYWLSSPVLIVLLVVCGHLHCAPTDTRHAPPYEEFTDEGSGDIDSLNGEQYIPVTKTTHIAPSEPPSVTDEHSSSVHDVHNDSTSDSINPELFKNESTSGEISDSSAMVNESTSSLEDSGESSEEENGSGEVTELWPTFEVPELDNSSRTDTRNKPPGTDNQGNGEGSGTSETNDTVAVTEAHSENNETIQEGSTTPKTTVKHEKVTTKHPTTEQEKTSLGKSFEVQSANTSKWVPILIAAVTSGVVFFFVGYFVDKCKNKAQRNSQSNQDYSPVSQHAQNGKDSFSNKQSLELKSFRQPSVSSPEPPGGVSEKSPLTGHKGFSTFKATKTNQSPIDINPSTASFDEKLVSNRIKFQTDNKKKYTIENTGTTVKVTPDGESCVIQGGPLGQKKYLLDHFHFHWGAADDNGSEHTVGGVQYAAELHLVHSDTEFDSFAAAVNSPNKDALAVVAVFLQPGAEHSKLKLVTDSLSNVRYKGESHTLPAEEFNPMSLLPANVNDYWTYSGSLTTAPYSENVTWIVYKQPIQVSAQQLEEFRLLFAREKQESDAEASYKKELGPYIVQNYRRTQPLEKRLVKASFR